LTMEKICKRRRVVSTNSFLWFCPILQLE
jgi:hypothetical protein